MEWGGDGDDSTESSALPSNDIDNRTWDEGAEPWEPPIRSGHDEGSIVFSLVQISILFCFGETSTY
jgi:hypothetical protein